MRPPRPPRAPFSQLDEQAAHAQLLAGPRWATDSAYSGTQVTASCPGLADECNASRQAPGADGKAYRVDTYIVSATPTGGRAVKKVTVVVRDYNKLQVVYARQVSTFDQSTG